MALAYQKYEHMKTNDSILKHDNDSQLVNNQTDGEISLRELLTVIWKGKWAIIATTFSFSVASVFYALSLPNIYKSEVLLAPVADNGSLKMPSQLGGLAALAGVNIASGGGDKTTLALEIVKSREFIGRFIEKHDLFVPVMAVKGWVRDDNSLVINPKTYDVDTKEWIRKVAPPYQPKPSLLETQEAFTELLSVSQDKETGMVLLSVHHFSPYVAQQWVSLLVKEINEEMRQRELGEAQRSIVYLNDKIQQTNVADVRSMLYALIEEQTKTVMLANVRDEYVFKTIDPAVVAEKKSKPKRALIVILAFMLSSLLSTMVVLVRHFSAKKS